MGRGGLRFLVFSPTSTFFSKNLMVFPEVNAFCRYFLKSMWEVPAREKYVPVDRYSKYRYTFTKATCIPTDRWIGMLSAGYLTPKIGARVTTGLGCLSLTAGTLLGSAAIAARSEPLFLATYGALFGLGAGWAGLGCQ